MKKIIGGILFVMFFAFFINANLFAQETERDSSSIQWKPGDRPLKTEIVFHNATSGTLYIFPSTVYKNGMKGSGLEVLPKQSVTVTAFPYIFQYQTSTYREDTINAPLFGFLVGKENDKSKASAMKRVIFAYDLRNNLYLTDKPEREREKHVASLFPNYDPGNSRLIGVEDYNNPTDSWVTIINKSANFITLNAPGTTFHGITLKPGTTKDSWFTKAGIYNIKIDAVDANGSPMIPYRGTITIVTGTDSLVISDDYFPDVATGNTFRVVFENQSGKALNFAKIGGTEIGKKAIKFAIADGKRAVVPVSEGLNQFEVWSNRYDHKGNITAFSKEVINVIISKEQRVIIIGVGKNENLQAW